MRITFLLGALILAGCGTKTDTAQPTPPASRPAAPAVQTAPEPKPPAPGNSTVRAAQTNNDPRAKLPQTIQQRHSGRTAEDWGRDLLDTNATVSNEAAFALRAIGPESLRFVLAGTESPYAMVRLRSIATALVEKDAAKYPEVFEPVLVKMLNDENREVRGWAALDLARCGFKSSASAIEKALAAEKDKEAKKQMEESLKILAKK